MARPVSRHFLTAHETVGRVHRDGANRALAEMLRYFQDEAVALVLRLKRVQDRGERAVELHVDDGSGYLPHPANSSIAHLSLFPKTCPNSRIRERAAAN